jgi:predicted GTPase
LAQAQAEADFIIWDGGSNDMPFIKPDLWVTVVDPLRASHEILYHPGEANLRAADIILINKVNTATNNQLSIVRSNINSFNPKAKVVEACSKISVDHPDMIRGKRVLCIEDGPTLTYGEMSFGAGQVAADTYGAAEVIDPRNCAVGSMAEIFHLYPHIGRLLPSLGYSPQHLRDLEMSIERAKCDLVLIATPVSLDQLINIKKPWLRVRYELADSSKPSLKDLICEFAHHQIYSKELTKKT